MTFPVTEAGLDRPCEGQGPLAFDAGLTDLLTTLEYQEGVAVFGEVANPHWLKRKKGPLARLQREDFQHKLSAQLVGRNGHLITEELAVDSMLADPTKHRGLRL